MEQKAFYYYNNQSGNDIINRINNKIDDGWIVKAMTNYDRFCVIVVYEREKNKE